MAPHRPLRLRLFDILEAIAGIERLMQRSKDETRQLNIDEYRAIERYVEIISEASRAIPENLKAAEPNIPWKAIADIGNIIRHAYDRVDQATLEDIAQQDLPDLKESISKLYTANKNPADPWP